MKTTTNQDQKAGIGQNAGCTTGDTCSTTTEKSSCSTAEDTCSTTTQKKAGSCGC